LSDTLLLITFTGRKSGNEYTTPVGYEQRGETLYITSQTDRVWWKNLRGGTSVTVRLRGEQRQGKAQVIENDTAVAEYVLEYIDRHGIDSVNRLAIAIESDEPPSKDVLAAGLSDTVVVEVNLQDE
ncbi:MAG: nitroreductase/quinone reductase family protein, partial [Halobacteriaceae archaeon]